MSTHWFLRVQLFACKLHQTFRGSCIKVHFLCEVFFWFQHCKRPLSKSTDSSVAKAWGLGVPLHGDGSGMSYNIMQNLCNANLLDAHVVQIFYLWFANCHVYCLTSGLFWNLLPWYTWSTRFGLCTASEKGSRPSLRLCPPDNLTDPLQSLPGTGIYWDLNTLLRWDTLEYHSLKTSQWRVGWRDCNFHLFRMIQLQLVWGDVARRLSKKMHRHWAVLVMAG